MVSDFFPVSTPAAVVRCHPNSKHPAGFTFPLFIKFLPNIMTQIRGLRVSRHRVHNLTAGCWAEAQTLLRRDPGWLDCLAKKRQRCKIHRRRIFRLESLVLARCCVQTFPIIDLFSFRYRAYEAWSRFPCTCIHSVRVFNYAQRRHHRPAETNHCDRRAMRLPELKFYKPRQEEPDDDEEEDDLEDDLDDDLDDEGEELDDDDDDDDEDDSNGNGNPPGSGGNRNRPPGPDGIPGPPSRRPGPPDAVTSTELSPPPITSALPLETAPSDIPPPTEIVISTTSSSSTAIPSSTSLVSTFSTSIAPPPPETTSSPVVSQSEDASSTSPTTFPPPDATSSLVVSGGEGASSTIPSTSPSQETTSSPVISQSEDASSTSPTTSSPPTSSGTTKPSLGDTTIPAISTATGSTPVSSTTLPLDIGFATPKNTAMAENVAPRPRKPSHIAGIAVGSIGEHQVTQLRDA